MVQPPKSGVSSGLTATLPAAVAKDRLRNGNVNILVHNLTGLCSEKFSLIEVMDWKGVETSDHEW
jgi:hypothetical protein